MIHFIKGFISKSGGRRFVMSMSVLLLCTVLISFSKIPPEIFRDVVLGTVAVYIAGNTFQKHSNNRSSKEDGE